MDNVVHSPERRLTIEPDSAMVDAYAEPHGKFKAASAALPDLWGAGAWSMQS